VVALCFVMILGAALAVSRAIPYSGLIGWGIAALAAGVALVFTLRENL
jgi:hypothetical protein